MEINRNVGIIFVGDETSGQNLCLDAMMSDLTILPNCKKITERQDHCWVRTILKKQKVQKLTKEYSKSFNLIVKEDKDSPKYTLHNERIAYKDLKEFCGVFCLIDPAEDTMFVFKKMTNSEIEALDVLFQQYHFKNY